MPHKGHTNIEVVLLGGRRHDIRILVPIMLLYFMSFFSDADGFFFFFFCNCVF